MTFARGVDACKPPTQACKRSIYTVYTPCKVACNKSMLMIYIIYQHGTHICRIPNSLTAGRPHPWVHAAGSLAPGPDADLALRPAVARFGQVFQPIHRLSVLFGKTGRQAVETMGSSLRSLDNSPSHLAWVDLSGLQTGVVGKMELSPNLPGVGALQNGETLSPLGSRCPEGLNRVEPYGTRAGIHR